MAIGYRIITQCSVMAYSLNLPALSPPFIACSVILTDPLNISHLSVKVLLGAQSCLTLVTPWTVARQAPLSLEFFRHEHWSGWPCPPPGGLPRGWPRSPASQADALPSESPGLLRFVPGMKLSFISRGRERDPAVEAWVWGDAGATLAGREADTTSASTPSSSRKLLACRSGLGPAPLPAPPRGSQPREHSPSSASQAPCLQRSLDFSPGKGVLPLPDDSLAALNPRGRDVPCTCSSPTFSVQFSCSVSDSLRPHEPQHARPPCPSPTPGVYPNSGPLSQWCRPTVSSSVVPFSCSQSFPASRSLCGKEQAREATPHPRSGVAAKRSYPTSKFRTCREKIPHVQGKRNPSKTVGIVRGHQRADRLKPQSQKTSQSDHTDHSLV